MMEDWGRILFKGLFECGKDVLGASNVLRMLAVGVAVFGGAVIPRR